MNYSTERLKIELLESRKRCEQAEVSISNLLHLLSEEDEKFLIPFDDVVATLQLSIDLLKQK